MPRLPVATKLPFWNTLKNAGVWPPGPAQHVEPPRRLIIAAVLFVRLVVIFLNGELERGAHVQSLIVAVMSLIVGFLVLIVGLLADRISDSRRLMEEILYRLRAQDAQDRRRDHRE